MSQDAQLRVVVLDAAALNEEGVAFARQAAEPKRVVLTKIDLIDDAARTNVASSIADGAAPLLVSSVTGEGLSELTGALRAALVGDAAADGAVLFTPRQVGLVEGALRALDKGDPARASHCLAALVG